jgi:glutamate-ammonia-ligase adenylyltransferase
MSEDILLLRAYSQFITAKLQANPSWQEWALAKAQDPLGRHQIEQIFQDHLGINFRELEEGQFLSLLRQVRQKLMIVLGTRDLSRTASLEEVMSAMTTSAEESLRYVCEYFSWQLEHIYGRPMTSNQSPMNLWVIGMGKLGGGELNVSSDIDLIFLYETDGQTEGRSKSISYHEWFNFLGKRVIRGLSELTHDGFVFRVDMRLRPNGDSGPLVCSLKMLEEYFLVQGREWERYAWIKARLVYPLTEADDFGLPKLLMAIVRPFVYRKYLDFGIIDAVRNLHQQIRHEANLRATQFPDRAADIKLGVGGIREIEFLAQMYQMIRGGQQTILRVRPTMQALEVIQELRYMKPIEVESLKNAYRFYRTLEHRLQWWNDAQIHYLPIDTESMLRLSKSMGLDDQESLNAQLRIHQTQVSKLFSNAFTLDQNPSTVASFENISLGFFHFYPEFKVWYERFIQSPRYRLASDTTKQNLDIIFLRLSEFDPRVSEKILMKFLDLIEVILRRSAYLSLLREFPLVLERVLVLFSESEWGANYLIKHPHLLDELIHQEGELDPENDGQVYWNEWRRQLKIKLDDALAQDEGNELTWNVLRDTHHAEIFQTLLADLGIGRSHQLSVEKVSDRLSNMADEVIAETLERIWLPISQKHDLPENLSSIGFGVIAYGKLGGKELGYGSDLDLVFIYDETDVCFKEAYIEHFAVLVRRLILWFTTVTSSGILFDIDTRLRPNGVAGLMVTSLSAFESYQKREGSNTAWVWEHQALTRARFCAGSLPARHRFEKVRQEVLCLPREAPSLKNDILQMRTKIHESHPNHSDEFDLKHDSGGMVDIEFMIQFIVLQYSNQYAELIRNVGNIALLGIAGQHQLINLESANHVANAYRLFRKKQHQLRLDGKMLARVPSDQLTEDILQARANVTQLWQSLMN